MPRSGVIGTYSLPPNTNNQAPNTPISSSMFNSFASDVQQTFNDPTPVAYGGTGAATAAAAATALEVVSYAAQTIAPAQQGQARANINALGPNETADRAFRRGNILGTVSQSVGVPTGAIIERGSNANGEYVRFADGTQVCWALKLSTNVTASDGALYRTSSDTWTFPAVFSDFPSSFVAENAGVGYSWGALGTGGTTMTSMTWVIFRTSSSVDDPLASLMVIGRWF